MRRHQPPTSYTTPTLETKARVSQALRSSYVRSSGRENSVFIPVDKIEALICPRNVHQELASSTILASAAIDNCVSDICGPHNSRKNRRKIFAILALIEREVEITSFIEADICDADLPLDLQYDPHGSPSTQSLALNRTGCEPRFIGDWKSSTKELFDRYQWIVNSPCLSVGRDQKILHHDLVPQAILPFIEGGRPQESRIGGFGSVSRVQIHPAHHNFKEYGNNTFAVKKLHVKDETIFNREVQALMRFSGKGNGHVITLLATYYHQEHYHLVFPWADGDLRSFWKQMPDPPAIYFLVIGADTRACNRLAILSDLGLATFNSKSSRSNISTNDLGCTPTYRAPEYDLPSSKISRAYDMWSFGCLLLEIGSWTVHGYQGVADFQRHRSKSEATVDRDTTDDNFFITTRDNNDDLVGQVKPAVWFEHLRDIRIPKDEFTTDLLDLIEQRLLVVNPKQRANINEVVKELDTFKLKGAIDIDYFRRRPNNTYCMLNIGDRAEYSAPSHQDAPPGARLGSTPPLPNRKRGLAKAPISHPPRKRLNTGDDISYSCPYRKRDPLKYNVRDFTGCALTPFPSISMVKRHVLKDHQHSTATGDSKDYSSQYSGNGNMGRTWKVEVDRRLRSRQASDQVLDWETLWEVLFPEDIDIPSGDYEPIIEHHEVNKAFSDRACQGKDMVLRKMHGLQSCTSNSDLEADAGVVWDSVQSYIQDQLQCAGPNTSTSGATSSSSSDRMESQQSIRTMRTEISRQQCGSTSSESLRRLAPRPTYASAPAPTSRSLPGLESVPSLSSDGPSTTTSTLPSLPEPVTEPFGNSTMPNNCTVDYSKMDDCSFNPYISSYDWTTDLDDFNFNLDFDTHVTADKVGPLDPPIGD
ncbi:hypothetical protein PG989_016357 [Apiospora arundinis]